MTEVPESSSRRTFLQGLAALCALPLAPTALRAAGGPAAAQQKLVLYPQARAFLDALAAQGGPPIYTLSYAEARQVLEKLQSGPVAKPPAEVEDRVLPVGPTGSVPVSIYRPQGVRGPLPAVMYFHGGGWVLGSKNTHDRLLRDLTDAARVAFVFVSYTPSPEAQFPVPIEQAYAATKYVAERGGELGLEDGRLAVAGDSVGGNMAAAATLLARERGGPPILFQVLFYPVTDAGMDTESYREFANGPWLTRPAMEWFWNAYAPNPADRQKITASPLRATPEQLRGLPPGLIITDEYDVLRDEGEAYAKKLIEAGVAVGAQRQLAIFHDFVMLNALADTPAARTAISTAAAMLARALER